MVPIFRTQRKAVPSAWSWVWVGVCLIAGCDAFKSNTPPPPTRAEREAMRREQEQATAQSNAAPTKIIPAVASGSAADVQPSSSDARDDGTADASAGTAATLNRPVLRDDHRARILPHTEWTIEETAADALGRIGVPAVPQLVDCLASSEPLVRRRAAEVLARIGPAAAAAVPALVERLRDIDPQVRQASARALGQIGPASAQAVPDLLDLFAHPSDDTPTPSASAEGDNPSDTTTDSPAP